MFGIIFFAAFQATRSRGNLVVLFLLSTIGVDMKRFGWSRPAMLIGFVLSARIESSVYQTVALYGASFLTRPIVLGLLALTLFSVAAAIMALRQRLNISFCDTERGRDGDGVPSAEFFPALLPCVLLMSALVGLVLASRHLSFFSCGREAELRR